MTGPIGGNREQQIQAWAKAKFAQLDAADGNTDGKIKRDTWNNFVGSIGTGKTISVFINEDNAMKSLRTYARRADSGVIKGNNTLLEQLNTFLENDVDTTSPKEMSSSESGPIEAQQASTKLLTDVETFVLPNGMEAEADFDASKVKDNIQGAYAPEFSLNGAGNPPTEAEKAVSLLLEAMRNADSLSDKQRIVFAIKNIATKNPEETICGQKCSDIIKMNNIEILQKFSVGKVGVIGNEITDPANSSNEEVRTLQANLSQARDFIKQQFAPMLQADTISDTDFEAKFGMSKAKCQRILQYLDSIKYEEDPYHNTMHGSDEGTIWVNSSLKGSENLESMVCMLIHEANHCDEAYLREFAGESEVDDLRHRDSEGNAIRSPKENTRQEELACERLGVLTTANLIKDGVLKDTNYGRYPEPGYDGERNGNLHTFISYLDNPQLLEQDLQDWADKGYSNYPDDFNGSVTLQACGIPRHYTSKEAYEGRNTTKIELTEGCDIQVGNDHKTIGNGTFIKGVDSAEIFSLPGVDGLIILDELEPPESVKNGVGKGNLVKTDTPVIITDKEGKTHTGWVYKENTSA